MLPEYLTSTVKHGGESLRVWGCFGGGKVDDLIEMEL